jgi:hypothetical protein
MFRHMGCTATSRMGNEYTLLGWKGIHPQIHLHIDCGFWKRKHPHVHTADGETVNTLIGKCWNAGKKLVRHWHFHLYLLIIPLPIKVAQHHNALLSFWQRTSRKKGLHILLALNAENGFLKFKAKK